MWNPERYLAFSAERARPFHDLLSRVAATDPAEVADLGCGPGTLTATLTTRWPRAHVVGVDSSAEMVAAARRVGGFDVVLADLREWEPDGSVDVLVSNATLQWVPGHLALLPRFVTMLAPGGWLAFQVAANFAAPSHTLLHRVSDSPRWRHRIGGSRVDRPSSHDPNVYLAALADVGCTVEAWETTYLLVLPGDDAVLEWVSGSALRPILVELDEAERAEFIAEYGALLREAYPRRRYGTVLPYRRVFAVARRP
ncbi:MAG TPA: trans-aconitate 2-methyltransferase [Jiangellaceae bacterium]|nr:trans-aconitate 2-methyltransferase [Jiangellaceae bacterium]